MVAILPNVYGEILVSQGCIVREIKRLFGLSFLITQFSVSITHNSKMVGPIAKSLFGKQ